MGKAIVNFFSSFNVQGTFKLWAFMVCIVGWAIAAIGIFELSLYYGNVQYSGTSTINQPSLLSGWGTTLVGISLYVISCFGWKFPKKEKSQGKKEEQQK